MSEKGDATVAMPLKLDVSMRLIEPKGNLLGFASVKLNDAFVVDDFRVLKGENGLFVGMPSKPDERSESGYRDSARPITKEFWSQLNKAVLSAYHRAVEKLQDRTASITAQEKQSVVQQLAEGAKQASSAHSDRPALQKADRGVER